VEGERRGTMVTMRDVGGGVCSGLRDILENVKRAACAEFIAAGGEGGAWSRAWLKGLPAKNRSYREFAHLIRWRVVADDDVGDLFGCWLYLLPREVRHDVLSIFGVLGLRNAAPGWARILLKGLAKSAIEYGSWVYGPVWHWLNGVEQMFGSAPLDERGLKDLEDDARDWCSVKTPSKRAEAVFRRGWDVVKGKLASVAGIRGSRGGKHDAAEFAKWPSTWLSNGASTVSGLPGVASGKYASYLAHLDRIAGVARGVDNIEDDPARLRVIGKRERKKVRGVVNAGFDLYVAQGYVFQGLGGLVKDALRTPPGGGVAAHEFWKELAADAKRAAVLPLDYPKFDHIPAWSWISRVLEDCATMLRPTGKAGAGKRSGWERCKELMSRAKVTVGDASFDYGGGVMSGWWVTSDLDTLINAAFYEGLKLEYRLKDVSRAALKGDDTVVFPQNWEGAGEWLRAFRDAFAIDQAKFPTDCVRAEFLRYRCGEGIRGRRGYPTRAVCSLLWGQAWQGGTVESCENICSTMEMLVSRGMDRTRCEEMVVARIASHLDCTPRIAKAWLHTPSCAGGRGWLATTSGAYWATRREKDLVEGSRGNMSATRLEDLDAVGQSTTRAAMRFLGLPIQASSGLVAGLVLRGGLTGANREVIVGVDRWAWDTLNYDAGVPWVRLMRPKWRIDTMWMTGILAAGLSWSEWVSTSGELSRLLAIERWMGRGWFRRWAAGVSITPTPSEPACSRLAMAAWIGDGRVGGNLFPARNPRSGTNGARASLLRCERGLARAGLQSGMGE